MIMLNLMPCSNCLNYKGIKQPQKKEKKEYIACQAAQNGHAEELLEMSENVTFCRFQKKEDVGEP